LERKTDAVINGEGEGRDCDEVIYKVLTTSKPDYLYKLISV